MNNSEPSGLKSLADAIKAGITTDKNIPVNPNTTPGWNKIIDIDNNPWKNKIDQITPEKIKSPVTSIEDIRTMAIAIANQADKNVNTVTRGLELIRLSFNQTRNFYEKLGDLNNPQAKERIHELHKLFWDYQENLPEDQRMPRPDSAK
jgi:hypothetical protein